MAKELPYFRFTVQEWQNGDITLEDYETQGIFINVCCYYWLSNCELTWTKLRRRFNQVEATLDLLFESGIIKANTETDQVFIDFLDEQFSILTEKSEKLSKAGKKGYLAKVSKAKARLKGGLSYKDNNKDKDKDKDLFLKEIPENLNYPNFIYAWSDWVKHRKEIKHKLTKSTATKQLKKLSKWGEVKSIEAINNSIEQGYQGIFEPRNNTHKKQFGRQDISMEEIERSTRAAFE